MDRDLLSIELRLLCGDAIALEPDKVAVLEAIEREGSISAASRSLDMSYRRTWLLVDEMNRCFRQKLVETTAGGGPGRGARVTEHGQEMRSAYRDLKRQQGA